MFLHKSDHRKKRGGGITGIFRLFLSLIIMGILGIGLYQAYRNFSGVDPLALSPESALKNTLTSEGVVSLITGLLSVSPEQSLDKAKQILKSEGSDTLGDDNSAQKPKGPLAFKFAVVTDSHTDNEYLKRGLNQAKKEGAKFVIGLGDFTNVGTIDELKAAKAQFEASGLPYYTTAGDHDLWDSRNQNLGASENFRQVFGDTYSSFSTDNTRFIIIYDADNYLGLDDVQLKWIEGELEKVPGEAKLTFVFTSIPLFHPSSDHVMGKVNEKLKNQAAHLTSLIKKAGVAEVIAGDTHVYSSYKEPTNDLKMTTVGAVTSIRNPQAPRFAMVEVYQDGSYNIQDTEIK